MTAVETLPCGCPVEASLFDTKDGARVLIVNPPYSEARPSVWCVDEIRWVTLTDAEFGVLKEVRA